jgi:hypothetical protein
MGNKRNQERVGEGTRNNLETQVAQRLVAKDRQRKFRAAKKEKFFKCQQILVNGNPTYTTNLDKSTTRLANQIAPILHKMTSTKGLDHQGVTMEKLLKQPTLKKSLLNLVVYSKQYETTFEIVDNMTRGWLDVKGCHIVDAMKARNVFTSMIVSNSTQNLIVVGSSLE